MGDIIPSDTQAVVMTGAQDWLHDPCSPQDLFIAGYAGTGKSTLASMLIRDMNVRAIVATYTGKAAHVLRRKGVEAQTIHSLIYEPIPGADPVQFRLAETSDLWDADLLVLDECSMISDDIANDLRAFGKKILIFGDPGQLPPIRGAGAFTRREPDFFLTEIHRQAAESPILRAATAAREGRALTFGKWGALEIKRFSDDEDILAPDVQVICGIHRNRWRLTDKIRQTRGYLGENPADGERVICVRNNREYGLFNGASGVVVGVPEVTLTGNHLRLRVHIDDTNFPQRLLVSRREFREHAARAALPDEPYRREVDRFDFGHVLTCHKAQGSEWPNVVVVDDSEYFRENRDRWLYTALTRASERLTILR